MKSPICWFGGKGSLTSKFAPYFPYAQTYVEPFGGGGSMLFYKSPSPIELYNDLNGNVVNFFRVLKDPIKFDQLYELLSLTPYSRDECNLAFNILYQDEIPYNHIDKDVQRAWALFIVSRQGFGGKLNTKSWGYSVSSDGRMNFCTQKYLNAIINLSKVVARLQTVQIDNRDFRLIMKYFETSNTLFYCDPPYIMSTRKSGRYDCEMSDEDHKELVEIALKSKSMIIISGYQHEIYNSLLSYGWKRMDFEVTCSAAGRTLTSNLKGAGNVLKHQKRIESIYINPLAQKTLEKQKGKSKLIQTKLF